MQVRAATVVPSTGLIKKIKVTRIRNDIFSRLRGDVHKGETAMWGC